MIDSDDDSCTDDDSPKKRRDLLTRRPSYRKILNDLGGGEVGEYPFGFLVALTLLINELVWLTRIALNIVLIYLNDSFTSRNFSIGSRWTWGFAVATLDWREFDDCPIQYWTGRTYLRSW